MDTKAREEIDEALVETATSGPKMMDDKEMLLVQRHIASILDHPSVYMGGPSMRSMQKALDIIVCLKNGKRLFSTTCDHVGWVNYKMHGCICPDCGTLLPDKVQDADVLDIAAKTKI